MRNRPQPAASRLRSNVYIVIGIVCCVLIVADRAMLAPPPAYLPLCSYDEPPQPEALRLAKFQPACPVLSKVTFRHLRDRYGTHEVYASRSSKFREDVASMEQGGLPEMPVSMGTFIDSILLGGATPTHDYVKMTDGNTWERGLYGINFHGIGALALHELAPQLQAGHGFKLPANLTWSLWVGARGSTTAMHVDDVSFNVLYVLEGAKRVLLIDPDAVAGRYECNVPHIGDNSCWSLVDILSHPPPEAVEVVLRRGDALVTPPAFWHAVENLEPTLAVGLNEFPRDCSMQRYERVRSGGRQR